MTESTHLTKLVDNRIADFVTEREPILVSIAPELATFADFSRDLLSGGKRFRAQFCYWGWRSVSDLDFAGSAASSGEASARAEAEFAALVELCTGLELFHAAALVHDDIIDKSDTRRGRPSAHRRFETLHRDRAYTGDAEDYGRASALLMGDLLLAWSEELVGQALERLDSSAIPTRLEFNRMRTEVTLGQYLDILDENAWPVLAEEELLGRAERVIVYKSAKYSVEAPLVLGARLHGADAEQIAALRAFGLPLGIAFQLRDDLLGVFGDAERTGKPSGDDLREGKRTVLIALTRQTLSPGAKRLFDELLGDPDLNAQQISMLQATISDSGAADRVEHLIAAHAENALHVLAAAPLAEPAKLQLATLATRITQRDA
ncbi:MAG: geranylgeranyl pyrophosphate synthase [Subtercola sp.]|nr:geranylgeranyl pyrophosphate synthase [Subtercola sp.]